MFHLPEGLWVLSATPAPVTASHPPGRFLTGRALVVRLLVVVAALALDLFLWNQVTQTAFGGDLPIWVLPLASLLAYTPLAVFRSAVPGYLTITALILCKLVAPGIITFAGFGVALFLLARNPDRRLARLALAGVLVPVAVNTIADTHFLEDRSELLGMILVSVILWSLLYLAVWSAGHLLFRAADQLVASQAEAARAREQALAQERLRISRELHDSVAHSLTAIVLQSAGTRSAVRRHTATEEDLESLLTGIEKTASQSLRELHRMLGMLRAPEDDSPERSDTTTGTGTSETAGTGTSSHSPMHGIEEIGELIEGSRSAGMDVSLATSGTPVDVDPSLGHTVYRVVQEGLSNVMRHAGPGARTTVTLDWLPAQLVISVRNTAGIRPPATTISGGFGLIGLRERVDILGGSLDSGPSADGYLLLARVPTTAPSPARTLAGEED